MIQSNCSHNECQWPSQSTAGSPSNRLISTAIEADRNVHPDNFAPCKWGTALMVDINVLI